MLLHCNPVSNTVAFAVLSLFDLQSYNQSTCPISQICCRSFPQSHTVSDIFITFYMFIILGLLSLSFRGSLIGAKVSVGQNEYMIFKILPILKVYNLSYGFWKKTSSSKSVPANFRRATSPPPASTGVRVPHPRRGGRCAPDAAAARPRREQYLGQALTTAPMTRWVDDLRPGPKHEDI